METGADSASAASIAEASRNMAGQKNQTPSGKAGSQRVRFKVMRRMLAIRGSMEIWQNGGGETQRRGAFGTS